MLAGFVRTGIETEPATLALEADLDDHVSGTKGCYTGQEIVARIHTYGHVNRKLCLLLLAPGEPIRAAQPLHELEDRIAVGRVLHAVPIPGREQRLGLGYLPKDFQALGSKLALADGAAVEVIGYEPLPA
jgi:folate-binding protein YgfZ